MDKDGSIETNITESMAKTVVEYNTDIVVDLAEINIDNIFEDFALKDYPIVKLFYNITKTGVAIREKVLLKKTLMFIDQLNSNGIENKHYQEYKEKLKSDKCLKRELEYALIIIDRYVEIEKSRILANLYYNYIDKKISWEQFQELSIIVDNIFINDLTELENSYIKRSLTKQDVINVVSFRRLKSQNLVEDIESSFRSSNGSINFCYTEYDYRITELGNLLYNFGMKHHQ